MARPKRRTFTIVLFLLALFLLTGTGVHYMLSRRLTQLVRDNVLPGLREAFGVDVTLGHLSSSLIKGDTHLEALLIGNPSGFLSPFLFRLDQADVDINLREILRGRLHSTRSALRGADLTIERNAAGQLNVLSLQPATPPTDGNGDPTGLPLLLPPLVLDRISLDLDIGLRDAAATSSVPFVLALTLAADNIRVGGNPAAEPGAFAIQGHALDDPESFQVALQGSVAPMTDPDQLSFTVEGSLIGIQNAQLAALLGGTEVQADAADIQVALRCREGRYLDGSAYRIKLSRPRATGKLATTLGSSPLASTLNLVVPVRGPALAPEIAPLGTLLTSNFAANTEVIAEVIETADKDGKLTQKIDDFLRKIMGSGDEAAAE